MTFCYFEESWIHLLQTNEKIVSEKIETNSENASRWSSEIVSWFEKIIKIIDIFLVALIVVDYTEQNEYFSPISEVEGDTKIYFIPRSL